MLNKFAKYMVSQEQCRAAFSSHGHSLKCNGIISYRLNPFAIASKVAFATLNIS